MGKQTSELEDKIEQLEQELNELRSINKALIRHLRSSGNLPEDLKPKKDYKFSKEEVCSKCQSQIEEVEIAGRSFRRCVGCGKRTKAKKV